MGRVGGGGGGGSERMEKRTSALLTCVLSTKTDDPSFAPLVSDSVKKLVLPIERETQRNTERENRIQVHSKAN